MNSVFVISEIIKVSASVISLGPSASADYTCLDLDYSGYHKNLVQYLFIEDTAFAGKFLKKTLEEKEKTLTVAK